MVKIKSDDKKIPLSAKAELPPPSQTLPAEGFFMAVRDGTFTPEVLDGVEGGAPYRPDGFMDSCFSNIHRHLDWE